MKARIISETGRIVFEGDIVVERDNEFESMLEDGYNSMIYKNGVNYVYSNNGNLRYEIYGDNDVIIKRLYDFKNNLIKITLLDNKDSYNNYSVRFYRDRFNRLTMVQDSNGLEQVVKYIKTSLSDSIVVDCQTNFGSSFKFVHMYKSIARYGIEDTEMIKLIPNAKSSIMTVASLNKIIVNRAKEIYGMNE